MKASSLGLNLSFPVFITFLFISVYFKYKGSKLKRNKLMNVYKLHY